MNRHEREITALAEAHGYRHVERLARHYLCRHPSGARVVVPASTSDRNWKRIMVGGMKRELRKVQDHSGVA
jgi:hypothetical protein